MIGSVRRALRARARGDDGASLVLVMVFVMAVGLVVTSLLSYAQAGIVSARATQSRQLLAADASGAMDVAINTIRNSNYADPATQSCPAHGVDVPGVEGTIRVTCTPAPGTGVSAGVVPITDLNRPGSAVLTLGTSPSQAGFAKGSNGILRIKGRVFVNSNIVVGGSVCPGSNCSQIAVDQAPVYARTGCTPGFVTSTVSVDCATTGSSPESKDPATLTDADIPPDPANGKPGGAAIAVGYAQPPSGPTELIHRIVPATCPATATVEFLPGYYDDAVALTSLTASCSKTFHFNPGVYYFDFRNEEVGTIPAGSRPVASGTNVWTINNTAARIVGGTLTAGPLSIPGSCVSPLTTTTNNQGVQFVFGGSSRMDVQAGQVELCGQYRTDRPALVIYGAKAGATVTEPVQATAGTAATPITAGETPFLLPQQAATVDGALATATLSRSAAVPRASVRLTGLGLANPVPPGSILVSAELRVTHKESATRSQDKLNVVYQPNPTRSGPAPAATTQAITLNGAPSALTTTTVSLTNALLQEVWTYGLSDLRLDYTVEAAGPQGTNTTLTADVDAVQLVLQWKPPSLRGQTTAVNGASCVATGVACPLIKTANAQTRLYLQGTTYAPSSHFDVNLTNVSGQVFKSGIIARSLAVSVTPSAGFVGPVIEVPDETGSGVNLDVYLAAYVCTGSASACSAAPPPSSEWRRVGRSTVSLESAFPVPSNGSRSVEVKSWNLLE